MAGLTALLTRRTDELVAAVNGTAADPVRVLGALSGQLRAEVDNSSEALRAVAEDATQRSSEAIDALLKRLTEQVEPSGASLRDSVERSAETSVGTLAGAGDRLRNELMVLRSEVDNSSEALRTVAEDATQRSGEAIEALLKRLTEQVEQSGASLRDSVDAQRRDLRRSARRDRRPAAQRIDASSIADLGKTSASIDQTVASAGERLSSVQGGLAAKVEEFQRALGGIASQVATLGRLSSTTQADATALASQLAKNADSLGQVAQELATQQQTLDAALEHRRDSLQTLVGELAGRGEAFEAVLGRFASNVEDSFDRAQARAQEISAALASTARGASVAVAGQFETIRETAAKERERTAQSLQTAIDQTNAQLTSALDQRRRTVPPVGRRGEGDGEPGPARPRRDPAGTAPRRAGAAAGDERDRRGDAPRRVGPDPGAERARRAGGRFGGRLRRRRARRDRRPGGRDRTAAVRYEQQPATRAAEPLRGGRGAGAARGAGGASADGPGRSDPDPGRCAPRGASSVGAGRRFRADCCGAGTAGPRRPFSRHGRRRQGPIPGRLAVEPARRGVARRAGCRRAARIRVAGGSDAGHRRPDRQCRSGRDVGSLASRRRRAVSRRLYTEAGQQAFDEIRRRYRADAQFRDAATRYVQEFERLLAKVSQNDRDGSQWRAYLLSNTGKVYTILAHASGRLG